MGERTNIEWTNATWNPIIGCTRVSPGCQNCYAERMAARFSGPGLPYESVAEMTPQGPRWMGVRCLPERLDEPLRWRKPRRIFVCSMSDLFHPDVPDEFIATVFGVMSLAGQHKFQVLTKRPERMLLWFAKHFLGACQAETASLGGLFTPGGHDRIYNTQAINSWPLPNVWLGVSVEDQCRADERIPLLLQVPAAVRWLSMEPLLGPVDLTSVEWPNKGGHRVDVLRRGYWNAEGWIYGGPSAALGAPRGMFTNHSDMEGIDWVVVGGESGPGARPMHPDWVRSIRDQCQAAGVPFLFKQWGTWLPNAQEYGCYQEGANYNRQHVLAGNVTMARVGKKAAGRLLDGRTWDEYPMGVL